MAAKGKVQEASLQTGAAILARLRGNPEAGVAAISWADIPDDVLLTTLRTFSKLGLGVSFGKTLKGDQLCFTLMAGKGNTDTHYWRDANVATQELEDLVAMAKS